MKGKIKNEFKHDGDNERDKLHSLPVEDTSMNYIIEKTMSKRYDSFAIKTV